MALKASMPLTGVMGPSTLDAPFAPTTNRQRRRLRILTAALDLLAEGYDAVHMRTVADRAGVAASTVYQHFSSKDDLLVSCLHHWLTEYAANFQPDRTRLDDPDRRLLRLIERVTDQLCATPRLAETVTRAYMCADGVAVTHAVLVRNRLIHMFVDAMGAEPHSRHHRHVGELLADVWAANILAVVQNRASTEDLLHRLARTVEMVSLQERRSVP